MYLLIVYDVACKRVNKVKSYLRTVLIWVQNSVFEGEVTNSQYMKIKSSLGKLIDKDEDSVIIYKLSKKSLLDRETIGVKKADPDRVIL